MPPNDPHIDLLEMAPERILWSTCSVHASCLSSIYLPRQLPLLWVKAAEVPEARRYDVPGMPAPSTAQPCRPSNSVHYPGVLSQAL